MAAHKAATAVTIAPVEEKSAFESFVARTWKLAAFIAVVGAGIILYVQHQSRTEHEANDHSWDRVLSVAREDRFSRMLEGEAAAFEEAARNAAGKQAGPWALYLAATSAADAQDYETAKAALGRLKQEYPAHPLVVDRYPLGPDGEQRSLIEHMSARLDSQAGWRAAHATLFENPPLPADAPRVRLRTDKGDIVVGLYTKEAPQHCENFLKLAREGFYQGTKFHRVIAGFMIQGGDPNTIAGELSTWGQGGPGYKVPREENSLKHFPGFLSAAKMGNETESSGSQFFITTASANHLDGKHVVFGKVVEGMDVVRAIEGLPIAAGTSDRPEAPAVLQATEIEGG